MATKARNASGKQIQQKNGTQSTASVAPTTTSSNGSSPSNGEMLRSLYVSLLRCRLMGERVLSSPGLVGKYHFAVEEEAVAVGATADLGTGDTMAASRRNLVALAAAGVRSHDLLSGFEGCGCHAAALLAFSSLSEDPFNAGTGIALAHKLAKQRHVVVAFGGEDAASLASGCEAMKLAGSGKLPVIYVIQNGEGDGGYAPHLRPVSLLARDGGFPGVIVDGQDVVAVWRVAQESIHRARNGGGPTLIDCRMDAARDPLGHMEHYLRKRSLWDEAWRKKAEAKIRAELEGLT